MTNKEFLAFRNGLIEGLSKQLEEPDFDMMHGICDLMVYVDTNVNAKFGIYEEFLLRCWRSWRGYSGDDMFPVFGDAGQTPIDAYNKALFWYTLWKGDYGQRRFELLAHLITYISRNLTINDVMEVG